MTTPTPETPRTTGVAQTAQPDPEPGEIGEDDLPTPQADQDREAWNGRGKQPRWQTPPRSAEQEE